MSASSASLLVELCVEVPFLEPECVDYRMAFVVCVAVFVDGDVLQVVWLVVEWDVVCSVRIVADVLHDGLGLLFCWFVSCQYDGRRS